MKNFSRLFFFFFFVDKVSQKFQINSMSLFCFFQQTDKISQKFQINSISLFCFFNKLHKQIGFQINSMSLFCFRFFNTPATRIAIHTEIIRHKPTLLDATRPIHEIEFAIATLSRNAPVPSLRTTTTSTRVDNKRETSH